MGSSISKQQIESINQELASIITTVISENQNITSNAISASQNMEIVFNAPVECERGLDIYQLIRMNDNLDVTFNNQNATDVKNAIQSILDNKQSSIMKIVREMFANLFESRSDINEETVKNIIQQTISSYVNAANLNSISQTLIIAQNGKYIFNERIHGNMCRFLQQADASLISHQIAGNLLTTVLNSEEIQRLTNIQEAVMEKKESGLASLLLAAALLCIAVAFIYMQLKSGFTAKGFLTILLFVIILIGLYLLIAWLLKLKPFEPPVPEPQYWGCDNEKPGSCKQYQTIEGGKYPSEAACNESKKCQVKYGCRRDADGYPVAPPECVIVKDRQRGEKYYSNPDECQKSGTCKQYWYYAGRNNKKEIICKQSLNPDQLLTVYSSEEECKAKNA